MKSKKAQLAIPFHWVFILIAGAIILLFFVTMIYRQKAVAEEKITITLISDIEEIFVGAGSGEEEAIHIIDIPKTEFEFICDYGTGVSEYSIKGTGIPRQTPTEVIFSPGLVKGKQLVIWSLPWSFPFKITNLMMVSSSDVRYVIFHHPNVEDTAIDMKNDMPDPLAVDLMTSVSDPLDTSNYKIKFVFIGVDPVNIDLSANRGLQNKQDKDVSAIKVESNFVRFYKKQGNRFVADRNAIYLTSFNEKDALYYAAIFAEDAGMYKCGLKKMLNRLKLVSEVYKERTGRLISHFSADPICGPIYSLAGFDEILYMSDLCVKDLDSGFCDAQRFQSSVVGNMGIKERNEILQGCILIY
ncbi:hypothetical protein KY342_01760 [Candidatus Woesearchaeota archaeon]|nr:hypothetical protein [Candidatus Woesearchaeota archaeon]